MPLSTAISYYLQAVEPYLALGAVVLGIALLAMQLALRARLKRLALGRNGSIEESVAVLSREVRDLKVFRAELEKYLKLAETRLRGSVQGVGMVRFNPFSGDGSGGNQSFSLALLDESGRGVVLSSLYARDRASVYAKPVEGWASAHELSDEEKRAITMARERITAHKK